MFVRIILKIIKEESIYILSINKLMELILNKKTNIISEIMKNTRREISKSSTELRQEKVNIIPVLIPRVAETEGTPRL